MLSRRRHAAAGSVDRHPRCPELPPLASRCTCWVTATTKLSSSPGTSSRWPSGARLVGGKARGGCRRFLGQAGSNGHTHAGAARCGVWAQPAAMRVMLAWRANMLCVLCVRGSCCAQSATVCTMTPVGCPRRGPAPPADALPAVPPHVAGAALQRSAPPGADCCAVPHACAGSAGGTAAGEGRFPPMQ